MELIHSQFHLHLNRPVHLARRDAYYERAGELLNLPLHGLDMRSRLRKMEQVLALLKTAMAHARFACRSPQATATEKDFLRFLQLMAHQVESLLAMMRQQAHFAEDECFLGQFLKTQPEQLQLLPGHYQRRAEDILEGVCHLLQLAHAPYHALHQGNFKTLTGEEQTRYRQAYASFREDLARYEHDAITPGRISDGALQSS